MDLKNSVIMYGLLKILLLSLLKPKSLKIIIFCGWGNGTINKQPGLFLELAKKLPEYKFKMILSDPDQKTTDNYYNNISSSINNLDYMGFVPFNEIVSYFSQACLLVNTSLREGFPNIFLQAWQCLTPVISLNVDPDNVITNHYLGRVSKNFDNLVKDVAEVMIDSKQRAEVAVNANKYIRENHSREAVIPEYQKLIL